MERTSATGQSRRIPDARVPSAEPSVAEDLVRRSELTLRAKSRQVAVFTLCTASPSLKLLIAAVRAATRPLIRWLLAQPLESCMRRRAGNMNESGEGTVQIQDQEDGDRYGQGGDR